MLKPMVTILGQAGRGNTQNIRHCLACFVARFFPFLGNMTEKAIHTK
jgi:hypothetical protein